jgi:hypothetical protein
MQDAHLHRKLQIQRLPCTSHDSQSEYTRVALRVLPSCYCLPSVKLGCCVAMRCSGTAVVLQPVYVSSTNECTCSGVTDLECLKIWTVLFRKDQDSTAGFLKGLIPDCDDDDDASPLLGFIFHTRQKLAKCRHKCNFKCHHSH